MGLGVSYGEGGGFADYKVDTYSELSSLTASEGEKAEVTTTTGILGFRKYSGVWIYESGSWIYGNQDIQNDFITWRAQVSANEDEITLNDAEILALQTGKLDKGLYNGDAQSIFDSIPDITDKTNKGGYTGTSQDIVDLIGSSSSGLPTGGYTGTAQDLDNDNNGSVNIHNDVNLESGVTPVNGWIPKYVNGQLILCMKEQAFYRGNPIVNVNANNPSGNPDLEFEFEFQRVGDYMITIKANESIDVTSSDIVIRPLMNGQTLTTRQNGEVIRREGKDNQGNDNDGRGTDQKNQMGNTYYYNNTTISNKILRIDHYPSAQGQEAAIWDLFIDIEEIFNPTIRN